MYDDAERWTEPWYAFLALTLSNLTFLVPALRALQFQNYSRFFICMLIAFVSSFYHACKPLNGVCLFPYSVLWFLDFEFATLLIPATLLYFIPFGPIYQYSPAWDSPNQAQSNEGYDGEMIISRQIIKPNHQYIENVLLLGLAVGIAVHLLTLGEPTLPVLIGLVGGCMFLIGVSWWWLWWKFSIKPRLDWLDLFIMLVLMGCGIPLYFFGHKAGSAYYWVIHAIWHVLMAMGQFYLLETRSLVHSGLSQFSPWPQNSTPTAPNSPPEPPTFPFPYRRSFLPWQRYSNRPIFPHHYYYPRHSKDLPEPWRVSGTSFRTFL